MNKMNTVIKPLWIDDDEENVLLMTNFINA